MLYTFTVCSLSNRHQVYDISWKNISDYCKIHGYQFVCKTTVFTQDRHPSWSKIPLLQDLILQNVATTNIVVWMDDDMMITNPTMDLKTLLLPFLESSCHIAVQEDTHGELFNCGFIAVKCTDQSFDCLQEVWDACDNFESRRGYWEQTTMQRLYRKRNSTLKPHMYIFPPKTVQSFFRPNEDPEYQWSPGDFIAHVSGLDVRERIDYMLDLEEYLAKPRISVYDDDIHRQITHPK